MSAGYNTSRVEAWKRGKGRMGPIYLMGKINSMGGRGLEIDPMKGERWGKGGRRRMETKGTPLYIDSFQTDISRGERQDGNSNLIRWRGFLVGGIICFSGEEGNRKRNQKRNERIYLATRNFDLDQSSALLKKKKRRERKKKLSQILLLVIQRLRSIIYQGIICSLFGHVKCENRRRRGKG